MTTAVLVDYIDQHRDQVRGRADLHGPHRGRDADRPEHLLRRQDQATLSAVGQRRARPAQVIEQVHADNYGVYGVRKMHAELNRQGHRVARCTVHRLMRAAGLRGISRAKGPRTTIPGTGPDTRPGPGRSRLHRAAHRTRCGSPTSPTAAPSPAGSTPRSSSTSTPAAWSAGSCRRACAPTWPWTPSRWACGPARTPAATPPA